MSHGTANVAFKDFESHFRSYPEENRISTSAFDQNNGS